MAPSSVEQPSLDVRAPTLLWKARFDYTGYEGEFALGSRQLVLGVGNTLLAIDRSTGEVAWTFVDGGAQLGSPPVVDEDENVYFGTSSIRKFSSDGTELWRIPLGGNLSPTQETTSTSRLLLAPDGTLLFSATDGRLYAVDTEQGKIAWSKQAGLDVDKEGLRAGLGVGDTVFFDDRAYRVSDGLVSAISREVAGVRVSSGSYAGLIGSVRNAGGGLDAVLMDRCGDVLAELPPGILIFFVGFADALIGWGDGAAHNAYVYAANGTRVKGPIPFRGLVSAIGADNTLYSLDCSEADELAESEATLLAYTDDFSEKWKLELGKPCTYAGVSLSSDGVLYLVRDVGMSTELIAVQTASPGPASAAWPMRNGDPLRRGWLR